MEMKILPVFGLVIVCQGILGADTLQHNDVQQRNLWGDDVMDVTDFSVYYDIKTNKTNKNLLPRPWYKPGWSLRLPFAGGPCECEGARCTCCTGIRIPAFNFDRRTCALLRYDPEDSTVDVQVQMNNVNLMKNTFSTRNPPPFCIPVPVPYLPPGLVDTCVRLFDVHVMNEKLHVCMDMDTRIDKAPVVILHFDCMDMGFSGVGLSKPGDSQISSDTSVGSNSEAVQQDSDVYDVVTDNVEMTTELFNSIRYI